VTTWWLCFVCGSDALCEHREPELVLLVEKVTPVTPMLPIQPLPPPKPPTSAETLTGTAERLKPFEPRWNYARRRA
jgi:hypothetical protein